MASAKKPTPTGERKEAKPRAPASAGKTAGKNSGKPAKEETTAIVPAKSPRKTTAKTGASRPAAAQKKTTAKKPADEAKKPKINEGEVREKEKIAAPPPETETAQEETPRRERAKKTSEAPPAALPPAPEKSQKTPRAVPPVNFPQEEKRSFGGRVLLLVALALVLTVSTFIFLFRPAGYTARLSSVLFLQQSATDSTVITVNGVRRAEVAGALTQKQYDGRGRVCVALISGRLYCIKGSKVTEVADGVSDFVLAADGAAFAWRTTGQELYYAQTAKPLKTAKRISVGVSTDRYCISPNGKELLYAYLDSRDGLQHFDGYTRTGSRPALAMSPDLTPVAVADRCRYFYLTDAQGTLFAVRGKNGALVPIADGVEADALTFNRDFSEVLIANAETLCLWRGGKEVSLSGAAAGAAPLLLANRNAAERSLVMGHQIFVKTFLKQYYTCETETEGTALCYLDRKGGFLPVGAVTDRTEVTVTDKGVYFLQMAVSEEAHSPYPDLYRCTPGKTEAEKLVKDIRTYAASADGAKVLYIDHRDMLWCLRSGGTPEDLASELPADAEILADADNVFYLCYRSAKEFWSSDNGAAPRLVQTEASGILIDGHTVAVFTGIESDAAVRLIYRNRRKFGKFEHISRVS